MWRFLFFGVSVKKGAGGHAFAAWADKLINRKERTVATRKVADGCTRVADVRLCDNDGLPGDRYFCFRKGEEGAHMAFGFDGSYCGGGKQGLIFGEELAIGCIGIVLRCRRDSGEVGVV